MGARLQVFGVRVQTLLGGWLDSTQTKMPDVVELSEDG